MEKVIERLVDKAVKSVNQALEARIAALEAKIKDRLSSNQHCNERQHSGPGESNSALQNQILRLQHSVARQEHAANFVMSGVPEKDSGGSRILKRGGGGGQEEAEGVSCRSECGCSRNAAALGRSPSCLGGSGACSLGKF